MKKSLLILAISCIILSILHAQEDRPTFNSYHKNIYIELLGSHILAGANFDMRLNKGRMDGIGFRAGVGGLSFTGKSQNTDITLGLVTFPLEFNNLVGKKNSSFLAGVGLLPIYASLSANGELTDFKFVSGEGFGLAGGFLTLGYRRQPKRTGFMFQANWNPLILRGSGFRVGWIGIGIGVGFK